MSGDMSSRTIDEVTVHVGSGATPRGGSEVYRSEGIMFIRSQNVRFDGLNLRDVAFIHERVHAQMSRSQLFPQDVLLNITGASIGRCCVFPAKLGQANVNQHVCAIRLERPTLGDAKFLSAVLSSNIGQAQVEKLNAGGNREGLNFKQIRAFVVPWPKAGVRNRIAEILDTLNEAIRKTEQVIHKLQQMKKGLLHDLLTRGIDKNGELRDPERHPEQFKDSPLGRIPRGWEVRPLAWAAEVNRGKFTHRPRNDYRFYGGALPFIQTGDIAACDGGPLLSFDQTLNERGAGVSKQFPAATIAVTIAANIADTAILGIPMYFPDSIVGAVVNPPHNVRFVELCIRRAKPNLEARAPESAQKNINLQDLRPLKIAFCPPSEQNRIADTFERHWLRIACESETLKKLKTLKKGLMDDLLTGKVRVTIPEEANL